ncbi:MAG: tetratricopeptide repeat protein [Deltaproteobacteria bacterium]|nr:tetratricopeptide repeat protein [Deltaproteobacteria bacterium]
MLEKHANGADVEQHLLLAQAWFDAFDNGKSAKALKRAAKMGSLDASVRAQLLFGELAFEAGRADEAKQHLQRVRKLDPQNRRAAQLLQNLGESVDVPAGDEVPVTVGFRTEVASVESGSRAVRQIVIGLVVGGIAVGAYAWWAHRAHAANVKAVEAHQLVHNGDAPSLRAAEAKYLEALELQGANKHALSGLAETYALLWVDHGFADDKAKALEFLEEARDADIEKAERFAAEMLVAYGEGRYPDVEQIATTVIDKKRAVSEKLYFPRGLAQRAIGDIHGGRDNLRRAFDLKGDAPQYATALGDAYEEDNDSRNSTFYWNLAASRNAAYVKAAARNLLGRSRKGEPLGALMTDLARLEQLPAEQVGARDRAAILMAKSVLLLRAGDGKGALTAAEEAITAGGESAPLLLARGWAQLSLGKAGAGLADLEAARGKAPGALRYLYALVDAYNENGRFPEALKLLDSVAGDLANDADYYVVLGNTQRDKGDFAKAGEAYDKAFQIEPEQPDALLGRGVLAGRQKNYGEASEWLSKAVNRRAKFPEVYEAVGLIYLEQGDLGGADKNLEKAEVDFKGRGTDLLRMKRFYRVVVQAFAKARGGSSYASKWAAREQAFSKS